MTAGAQRGASDFPVISPLNLAHVHPIDTSQVWWYEKAWGSLTLKWFEYLTDRGEHIWRLLKNAENLTAWQPVGLKLSPPVSWVCDLLVYTGTVDESQVEVHAGMSRGFAFFNHLKGQPQQKSGDVILDFQLSLHQTMIESVLLSSIEFTEKDWEMLHAQDTVRKWGGDIAYSMPDDDFIQNPSIFSLTGEAEPGAGVTPGEWLLQSIMYATDGGPDYHRLKRFVRNPGVPSQLLQEVYKSTLSELEPELGWMAGIMKQMTAVAEEVGEDSLAIHEWMDEHLTADENARFHLALTLSNVVAGILSNPNYAGSLDFLSELRAAAGDDIHVATAPTVRKPPEPAVKYFLPDDGELHVREHGKLYTNEYVKREAVESLWWQLFEAPEGLTREAVRRLIRRHARLPEEGVSPVGKGEELVLLGCLFEAVLGEAQESLGAEDVPFEWLLATL